MKKALLFLFAALITNLASAQSTTDSLSENEPSYPRREFLPVGHLFDPIVLDPLEAQTYVSVLPAYWTDGKRYDGTIVPFAFGLRKPFFRWYRSPERASELSLDVASFTQFEVFSDPNRTVRKQRRQLMNNDYRVGFWYNIRVRDHVWRIRLYHLSSHLGDDYMIRNQINYYLPNAANYELLDLTYSHEKNGFRKYIGGGFVLRKPEDRKLLAGQAGFYYRNLRRPTASGRFVGGIDLKVWQQTNFKPGVHAGLGYEVGKPSRHLTFLLEAYTGFRPYSLYENQDTNWLGLSVYFNPI
ncbi:DUF1207 domain-containing protein [Tellurirhabdus bombi]|uniref:DUF1207 domain-containing protein n=1 Tax=Tellurirhabdus bombi TaxID=2907205 RepID=UPI001F20DE58|nr:DUF1207 domain-containing protein [Tellurirhabdus bombi]